MAQVEREPRPFTSQENTLPEEPSGHSVNWLRSPLFTLMTGNALQKYQNIASRKIANMCAKFPLNFDGKCN